MQISPVFPSKARCAKLDHPRTREIEAIRQAMVGARKAAFEAIVRECIGYSASPR